MNKIFTTGFFCIWISCSVYAQQDQKVEKNSDNLTVISLEDAISNALNYNHQVRISRNNAEAAQNSATAGNAGLLPQVFVDGNFNPALQNIDMTFFTEIPPINRRNAWTRVYNASVGLSYNLFDGFNKFYVFDQLKGQNKAAQAQSRMEIENTLLGVINTYLEIAQLEKEVQISKKMVLLSQRRLKRSKTAYEFGTQTRLEVFNAEVDLNTDSVNLVRTQQAQSNAKRNLNVLMGLPAGNDFSVVTDIELNRDLEVEPLLERALKNNAALEMTRLNKNIADLDLRISRSQALPSLDLNLSYAYNRQQNEAGFIKTQEVRGWNGGLVLRYNLFDGRRRVTQTQNARIAVSSNEEQLAHLKNETKRDVLNAYQNYQTNLYLLNLEQRNLETAQLNFERTEEAFSLGQVTTTQFREAQLNLTRAEFRLVEIGYQAKLAEMELYRLAGLLVTGE